MAVKVVMKGKTPEPDTSKLVVPKIIPPRKRGNVFISTLLKRIVRTFRIMLMDLRLTIDPELRKEYEDYRRFTELARRKS